MMPVDHGRRRERLRCLREQLARLHPLAAEADPGAGRMADPLSASGRSLQTSVEAMIDIAYHLSARL